MDRRGIDAVIGTANRRVLRFGFRPPPGGQVAVLPKPFTTRERLGRVAEFLDETPRSR